MHCVFDVYDESMTRYERLLREWDARQRGEAVEGHARVAGAELYYRVVGRGRAIIVIHGGPDFDHTYLLPDMDRLAEAYQLIYYDQRGRGQSRGEVNLETLGIETYVDDLEGLRKHLGLDPVAILGHSWGGVVAMHYAIRHPAHLSHMVLLNTAPASNDDLLAARADRVRRRAKHIDALTALEPAFERGDPEAVAEFYAIDFSSTFKRPEDARRLNLRATREQILSGRALENRLMEGLIWSPGFTLLPQLESVRVPTLVIHGDRDFFPVQSSAHIAQAIPGARLTVLRDSGHFSYIDASEQMREALVGFLQGS